MTGKTLHKKLKIGHHKQHIKPGVISGALEEQAMYTYETKAGLKE